MVVLKAVHRLGATAIRQAMLQAMRLMGQQFVLGQNMDGALSQARKLERQGYTYSYDMLGEAAMTEHDAERYFDAYRKAILASAQPYDRGKIRAFQSSCRPCTHAMK